MTEKSTKNLDSKLLKYTAAAGAIVGITGVNAQVTYTDVSPDVTINTHGAGVNLDIDNDGTPDFIAAVFDTAGIAGTASTGATYVLTYAGAVLQPQNGNSWLGFNSSGDTVATVLNANDDISGAGSVWSNGGSAYLEFQADFSFPAYSYAGSFGGGAFGPSIDKYIGLKFSIGPATHYGWVRLDVSADGKSVTIKDYAYDATADAAIPAGDTGAVASSVLDLSASVNVIGAIDKVIVHNHSGISNGTVSIIGMNGQVVKTEAITGAKEIINTEELSTGIYVVRVAFEEGIVTKKVYLR
ncbi:MAG: hypothetical protein ACI9J3_000072 [Parvicellaceae bacterium]|jgi:hypothetical protein